MPEGINNTQPELEQITRPLNAMHLSQLTAYAYGLPPLFFCSQYYELNDESIIEQCNQRLIKLVTTEEITTTEISKLLIDKEYFDTEEARLRVAPNLSK
jgi:hypothetical protein